MAMLELYLIRHGLAEERGKDWPDDSKRPLTPEGIARLRKEARGLNEIGVGFDQIVTSPLVRARQTAEVFSEELKANPPIVTSDAGPAGSPPSSRKSRSTSGRRGSRSSATSRISASSRRCSSGRGPRSSSRRVASRGSTSTCCPRRGAACSAASSRRRCSARWASSAHTRSVTRAALSAPSAPSPARQSCRRDARRRVPQSADTA